MANNVTVKINAQNNSLANINTIAAMRQGDVVEPMTNPIQPGQNGNFTVRKIAGCMSSVIQYYIVLVVYAIRHYLH